MSAPYTGPAEYEFDLFWHALNYRGADTKTAQQMWVELEACVERLVDRERDKCLDEARDGDKE